MLCNIALQQNAKTPIVVGNPPGNNNHRIVKKIAPLADRFIGFEDHLNLTRSVCTLIYPHAYLFINLFVVYESISLENKF